MSEPKKEYMVSIITNDGLGVWLPPMQGESKEAVEDEIKRQFPETYLIQVTEHDPRGVKW